MGPEAASVVTAPRLVAVGHVTWDVLPDDLKYREPGGAVSFAAVTARSLGIEVAVVTSCAEDYPIGRVIDQSERFVRVASRWTSTFENRYEVNGDRQQILHRRASDITIDDVPEDWRSPELLFVGPLTQELPFDCLDWFSPRVSCVVPQGWLRSWDLPLPSPIKVSACPPEGIGTGWDVCVLSESEVSPETLEAWREVSKILVVTKGSRGADLYERGSAEPKAVPSFADSVEGAGKDTTGAGDVFAAAMLIRYAETGDAMASASFASRCAALSTRGPSWSAVVVNQDLRDCEGF